MIEMIEAMGFANMSTMELVIIVLIVFAMSFGLFVALSALKILLLVKMPIVQKMLKANAESKAAEEDAVQGKENESEA